MDVKVYVRYGKEDGLCSQVQSTRQQGDHNCAEGRTWCNKQIQKSVKGYDRGDCRIIMISRRQTKLRGRVPISRRYENNIVMSNSF